MDKNDRNVSQDPHDNNNASGSSNTQDPHQRHGMFTTSNVGDLIPAETEQRGYPPGFLPNPDSTLGNTQVFSQRSANVAQARGVPLPHEISYIYPCRFCMEPQASTSTHEFDEAAFARQSLEQEMEMDVSSEPFPDTSAERSDAVTDFQKRMQTEEIVRCRCKRHRDANQNPSPPNPEKKSKFE